MASPDSKKCIEAIGRGCRGAEDTVSPVPCRIRPGSGCRDPSRFVCSTRPGGVDAVAPAGRCPGRTARSLARRGAGVPRSILRHMGPPVAGSFAPNDEGLHPAAGRSPPGADHVRDLVVHSVAAPLDIHPRSGEFDVHVPDPVAPLPRFIEPPDDPIFRGSDDRRSASFFVRGLSRAVIEPPSFPASARSSAAPYG